MPNRRNSLFGHLAHCHIGQQVWSASRVHRCRQRLLMHRNAQGTVLFAVGTLRTDCRRAHLMRCGARRVNVRRLAGGHYAKKQRKNKHQPPRPGRWAWGHRVTGRVIRCVLGFEAHLYFSVDVGKAGTDASAPMQSFPGLKPGIQPGGHRCAGADPTALLPETRASTGIK